MPNPVDVQARVIPLEYPPLSAHATGETDIKPAPAPNTGGPWGLFKGMQQAMAYIATPYSTAALPLRIHAVETEECFSRHMYFVCKRAMDIVLAALLLPLLVVLMLLVAVLIKVDSPGSSFFYAGPSRGEEADQRRTYDMGTVYVPILQIPFYGE